MDTAGLRTFITAAELESFSHAADRLYLTQPAVSKRVAALEEELGALLFDRIGRRVTLTEAGKELLPRARAILNDIEDSRRLISNFSGAVAGRLSIGTSHHIGLHRLPPVLRSYSKQFPDVELDLHFMDSEAACRAVLAGDLELGIVTLPPNPIDDLETEIIWPDPLSIVVNREHPLASHHNKKIDLQALLDIPSILPAHGTYTRELLEQVFADSGLVLYASMTTNYLETIKMMVSVGLGWSILPRSMLNQELVALKVKGVSISRQLGIVNHRKHTNSNAARALMETLEKFK
ncbi:LysR family transcriptional regulator [Kaarinaea lacus]